MSCTRRFSSRFGRNGVFLLHIFPLSHCADGVHESNLKNYEKSVQLHAQDTVEHDSYHLAIRADATSNGLVLWKVSHVSL